MTRCAKRFCIAILILFLVLYGLSSQVSLGFELGLPGTAGLAATYEQQSFRGELAAHFFALDLQYSEFIGKAIISTRLTPTKRHVLYGGAGLLGYFDPNDQEYMVGIGPAMQYAWKFHEGQSEFHLDLLLPLIFKHNYDEGVPDDDWPSAASFVHVLLLVMAPTIGFSWSF